MLAQRFLILGPILTPTAIALGIDPLHFAIIMCVNLTAWLATPPMGLVLFVASAVARKAGIYLPKCCPFYLVHIAIILLVTYVPALSMTIPRWLGFG